MSQLRKSSTVAGVDTLRTALAPLRDQLLDHPIYASVNTLPRLRCFMRYHVFAVWDFMCLAKRLQRDLTSLDLLWLPPARPALARFINSLILAEETDLDPDGAAASHFELYVQGMEEVGASTTEALGFLAMLRDPWCRRIGAGRAHNLVGQRPRRAGEDRFTPRLTGTPPYPLDGVPPSE